MEKILKQLRKKGYRLTKPRKMVLKALTFYPQSVTDIVNSLEKKQAIVDMATIYRTLQVLVGLGVVAKIQFNNTSALYELSSNNHHHHLVCNNCGSIEDICLNEDLLMNQVNKQTSFKVQSHSLEFFGLCVNCQ